MTAHVPGLCSVLFALARCPSSRGALGVSPRRPPIIGLVRLMGKSCLITAVRPILTHVRGLRANDGQGLPFA